MISYYTDVETVAVECDHLVPGRFTIYTNESLTFDSMWRENETPRLIFDTGIIFENFNGYDIIAEQCAGSRDMLQYTGHYFIPLPESGEGTMKLLLTFTPASPEGYNFQYPHTSDAMAILPPHNPNDYTEINIPLTRLDDVKIIDKRWKLHVNPDRKSIGLITFSIIKIETDIRLSLKKIL